jgi:hypothetical protein
MAPVKELSRYHEIGPRYMNQSRSSSPGFSTVSLNKAMTLIIQCEMSAYVTLMIPIRLIT